MSAPVKLLTGGGSTPLPPGFYAEAGVDEAGRGPLAGPVVAAAVILDPACTIAGIGDSKKLSPRRRTALSAEIRETAPAWAIAWATPAEIDEFNILHASLLAMSRAINALPLAASRALIDGNRCPKGLPCESEAIVGGDGSVPSIGAASILAKVARDADMLDLHALYPVYGFDRHKGYPTKDHMAALSAHGPTPVHRRSFAPVREALRNA